MGPDRWLLRLVSGLMTGGESLPYLTLGGASRPRLGGKVMERLMTWRPTTCGTVGLRRVTGRKGSLVVVLDDLWDYP